MSLLHDAMTFSIQLTDSRLYTVKSTCVRVKININFSRHSCSREFHKVGTLNINNLRLKKTARKNRRDVSSKVEVIFTILNESIASYTLLVLTVFKMRLALGSNES